MLTALAPGEIRDAVYPQGAFRPALPSESGFLTRTTSLISEAPSPAQGAVDHACPLRAALANRVLHTPLSRVSHSSLHHQECSRSNLRLGEWASPSPCLTLSRGDGLAQPRSYQLGRAFAQELLGPFQKRITLCPNSSGVGTAFQIFAESF